MSARQAWSLLELSWTASTSDQVIHEDKLERAVDVDSQDEQAFVDNLAAGDDLAFEKLLRIHGPGMLQLARRILSNEEDARDALQDAFIAVYRSVSGFRRTSSLSTWLYRVVVNASLKKLRTTRRGRMETLIDEDLRSSVEDGHRVEPSAGWRDLPENRVERDELRAIVRASIGSLPRPYRVVLDLRDIQEMSTEETAAILGISENAVKIRLHRARHALRALLDPHLRSPPG
jgi:RNA polymerase sigma-70 factor, ECF subfamily